MAIKTNSKGHIRATSTSLVIGHEVIVGNGQTSHYHDSDHDRIPAGTYRVRSIELCDPIGNYRGAKRMYRFVLEATDGTQFATLLHGPSKTHRIVSEVPAAESTPAEQARAQADLDAIRAGDDTAAPAGSHGTEEPGIRAAVAAEQASLAAEEIGRRQAGVDIRDNGVAGVNGLYLAGTLGGSPEGVASGPYWDGYRAELDRETAGLRVRLGDDEWFYRVEVARRWALSRSGGNRQSLDSFAAREIAHQIGDVMAEADGRNQERASRCGDTVTTHGRNVSCALEPHSPDVWHDDEAGTTWTDPRPVARTSVRRPATMKRFWVFTHDWHYPNGGLNDLRAWTDTEAEAISLACSDKSDYVYILDTETMEVISVPGGSRSPVDLGYTP